MTAFFTLKACGTSTTVLVAGGGLTPADCVVPATALVTVPIEVVDRSVPTSWHLGSGEEADGLQKDRVSMQQFRYLTIQQGNNFIPGGFDYMRFLFAYYPMTKGRVSVNSTDGLGELFLLAFPSASLSTRGFPLSVVSLSGRASAA
jgi:hypothetical protein